jgi:hypothetical protein
MAQPFSVPPITFDSKLPEIIMRTGDNLMAVAAQKKKQEAEVARLAMEQKKDQEKIFGETVKQMTSLAQSYSGVGPEIANRTIVDGINRLKEEFRQGRISTTGQLVVGNASLTLNGYNGFVKNGDAAVEKISSEMGFDKEAMTAFLKRTLASSESPATLGDPFQVLSAEVSAHPELYYNFKNGASVAGKGLVDVDKTAPVIKVEKTIDPTGVDKRTAAFSVPVRIGEVVEEYKDPVSGLPIKRTKLASENATVGKQQFAALPEDQYQKLITDKSIANHVRMMGIAYMRQVNKEAFDKAGIKDGHLAVSKNNSTSFVGNVDGYIDPFSESNIYMFERIAARDFLANSRGYDSNGYSIGMDIKTSQDRTKPSQTTVINQTGTQTPIVDLWSDIDFGPGKTITSNGKNIGIAMTGLNVDAQAIIRSSINKGRKEESQISDDEMIVVPAEKRQKIVYRWDPVNKTIGTQIGVLTEEMFNPKAQPTAKGKEGSIRQAQGKQGKVMTAAEWKALPLAERLEKQKEGWTFK